VAQRKGGSHKKGWEGGEWGTLTDGVGKRSLMERIFMINNEPKKLHLENCHSRFTIGGSDGGSTVAAKGRVMHKIKGAGGT